jgi:hypothetical protein
MRKYASGAGVVALALGVALTAAPAEERDEAWALQRLRLIKRSDTEGWKKVPWAGSLLAARRASQMEGRPLFLFTLDGNLDTGRC